MSMTLLPTPTSKQNQHAPSMMTRGRSCRTQRVVMQTGSILYVEASPASLFQWRDDVKEWLTTDGFGAPLLSAFASLDQDGCWLKTSQGYCQRLIPMDDGAVALESFSETWPSSGTMRNGKCYRRPPLVRRISEGEYSLLPTARATDGSKGGPNQRGSKGDMTLPSAVQLMPTPQAQDFRSGTGYNHGDKKQSPQLRHLSGGLLSPQFVEAILGFPTGWTDLNA